MRIVVVIASFVAMTTPLVAEGLPRWIETTVSINGGAAPLYGTLTIPTGQTSSVATLILPGSGPTDRNGNFGTATNNSLLLLAHDLADEGIPSLRIDKRGVAESSPAGHVEEDLRFETYVDDAVKWTAFLKKQSGVRDVFLIGHSEGALVATLAAKKEPVNGLVLIDGAGRPAPDLIRGQLVSAGLAAPLQAQSEKILHSLQQGKLVEDIPPELAKLYRPSVQPYLVSWFKYDPAGELARLSLPVLIVQGTTDLQVSLTDAHRLTDARKGIKLLIIEGMNHVLKVAPADRAGNLRLYSNPDVPLAQGLVSGIVDFLRAN